MGLLLWMPFTDGTPKQQGLGVIPFAGTAPAANNNGKLGKCGYSTSAYYCDNFTELSSNTYSIAYWIKYSAFPQYNEYVICINGADSTDMLVSLGVQSTNGTLSVNAGGSGTNLSLNTWYHVAYTHTGSTGKLYLNGNLIKTYSITGNTSASHLTINGRYGSRPLGTFYINDLRIYKDHALSPKEVEEIAKGLVLHYKLDYSNPNLLSKYVTPGQAAPGGTATAGRTNYYGDYGIIIPAAENADTYFRLFLKQQLTQNTVYTISCYVSGLLPGSQYNFPLFSQGNAPIGALSLNHNGICSLTFTMNSSTQTSVTAPDGSTVYICFMDDSARTLASGQGAITVTGFKIEQGNIATPFNTGNSSVIYDSSGYSHNGTITGSLTAAAGSPRYGTAIQYPDSACSIGIGNLSTMVPEGNFTFNIWFKKKTGEWSSKNWETILGGPSGFEFEGKLSSSTNAYIHPYSWGGGSTSSPNSYSIAYTLDEWHMVTMVRTTSATKFYLDGEWKVDGTAGSIPSGDYFIGAWKTATQQNYRGYFSDARIYSTALTPNQVKELYTTSMSIDSSGNVHTRELKEL